MAMVDTVTPNETEAAALTGVEVVDLESAHRAARVLLNKGVRNVIITLGGNGVYCTDGTREELINRIAVDVVDTTGAGDIFGGSALHRLLDFRVPPEELDRGGLEEIARFAVTAASLSTQHPGGIPSIPSKEEVEAFLSRGA